MYKILLVDDEVWALQGIKESFRWKEWGFEVITETTKSTEALKLILSEKPDVVFTDIRMPKLSGIELMGEVRKKGLDTEFVVISGFGEFSYAQQAIQQGAFDYCLKPLQMEYSDTLLKKLSVHLENKMLAKGSDLFEVLLENSKDKLDNLKSLGLKCNKPYYQIMVLFFKDIKPFKYAEDFLNGIDYIKIISGKNKIFYVFNTNENIKEQFSIKSDENVYVGISSLSISPDELTRLYTEADIAACNFFVNDGVYVNEFKRKSIVKINQLMESLISNIEQKNMEDFRKIAADIPGYFKNNELLLDDVVHFWNQLVAFILKYFSASSINSYFDFMDYHKLLYQFGDIVSMCDYIVDEVQYLIENLKETETASETGNLEFKKLLKYVQENFTNQLYLRDLAKKYFINRNYCCYLFKKYTNSTFTDYINKLRMDKSRELLKTMEMTIEEIAQIVGYNDYFYFIRVFKKNCGTTPSKYRKQPF